MLRGLEPPRTLRGRAKTPLFRQKPKIAYFCDDAPLVPALNH